jgi:hypothetical protein
MLTRKMILFHLMRKKSKGLLCSAGGKGNEKIENEGKERERCLPEEE